MANVVIIGAGPAGISTALYTAMAGIDTTVIAFGNSSLEKATKIANYYGFSQGISGKDLLKNGIDGAKAVGAKFVEEEVVGIGFNGKLLVQTSKNEYQSDFVVVATGSSRLAPAIKGLNELEGKGVSYCAVCDAFFYKGKDVCVLGSGEYALHEIYALLPVVKSVTLLTNGEDVLINIPKEVKIIKNKVKSLIGESHIEKVEFENSTSIDTKGLFVAYGVAGSAALAKKIGAEIKESKIVVDENMATNIPNLYAVGDCTGGLLQVSKAVYDGAKAGTEIIRVSRNK